MAFILKLMLALITGVGTHPAISAAARRPLACSSGWRTLLELDQKTTRKFATAVFMSVADFLATALALIQLILSNKRSYPAK